MKYRNKSVVDAQRWHGQPIEGCVKVRTNNTEPAEYVLDVVTPAGQMFASSGDWIITGQLGELYVLRNETFAAEYEPAE